MSQASVSSVRRANDAAKAEGEAAVSLIESTAAAGSSPAARDAVSAADAVGRESGVGSRVSLRV